MSSVLAGQTAVITGAVRGIGRAIALRLAKSEASLIINYYQNEAAAVDLSEKIADLGGHCVLVRGDVSHPDDAQKVIQSSLENFNRLDILVNNAGINRDNLLLKMKEDEFSQVIAINLLGTFHCTKYASKIMMKNRYGRIVNISSVVGIGGNAGQSNYAASKAGIIGFTKSVAKELGQRNITVNAIAPGFIQTDMTGFMTDKQKEDIMLRIPLKRLGHPIEIANMVIYLISNKANYITGQVFRIDGGLEL